jgi:hypothetical protein
MRTAAGEIESVKFRLVIGWLEASLQPSVARDAINRALPNAVTAVNIIGR